MKTQQQFAQEIRKAIKARNITLSRFALDLGENPVHLFQLLSGDRKYLKLQERIARTLNLSLPGTN
jgi:predicted transcriptional regulator